MIQEQLSSKAYLLSYLYCWWPKQVNKLTAVTIYTSKKNIWLSIPHTEETKGLLCWLERLLFNEKTQFQPILNCPWPRHWIPDFSAMLLLNLQCFHQESMMEKKTKLSRHITLISSSWSAQIVTLHLYQNAHTHIHTHTFIVSTVHITKAYLPH